MRLARTWALAGLVAVTVSSLHATADPITYTATLSQDTRLLSVAPGSGHGSEGVVAVYNNAGNTQHSLIEFNLAGLPEGVLVSAELSLAYFNFQNGSSNGQFTRISRYTNEWDESTATWNNQVSGGVGSTAGPEVSAVVTPVNDGDVVTFDVTSIVGAWLAGEANEGFFLRGDTGNLMHFYSSDAAGTNGPTLTITIDSDAKMPEPTALALLGAGLVGGWLRRRGRG